MLYQKKGPLFFFLIPGLLMMLVFLYYPFLVNIYNSFFEMSGMVQIGASEFIGLQNYKTMIADPKIHKALINTFIMMAMTVIFQVGIALILALMVDSIKFGQQFFRTTFFFPIVISATAIGLMFNLFYNYNGGMFNQLLEVLGKDPLVWLEDGRAFTMITLPVIWQYVGFYFVIILTGLGNISEDVFEAAEIDGATGLQKIYYITLPLLRNTLATCSVLAVTGALKVFDLPHIIAPHGAPSGSTYFTGTYMYDATFYLGNVDYGCAIAVLIVVLGVVVSKGVNSLFKPSKDY